MIEPDLWQRRSFLGWTAAFGAALLTRPALALPQPRLWVLATPRAMYVVKSGLLMLNWPGNPLVTMRVEAGTILPIMGANVAPGSTAEVVMLT